MTALLRLLPPARTQFRSRRATPTGAIVVHTAENTPDFVAFDGGAEAVARFIQARTDPGSYHRLVDSDSRIALVDFADEAFHVADGSNRWSIGLSVATRADVWPLAPQEWRDGAIQQLAEAAAEAHRWLVNHGHPGCPPKRITRAEYRNLRAPGFISHAELDPGRRTDPGPDFPWDDFLAAYDALINPKEPDDMATPHLEVPAAVKAIADMYEWYGVKRPADRRFPETPEALEYQLDRYFASEDPAAFLVRLGKELRDE